MRTKEQSRDYQRKWREKNKEKDKEYKKKYWKEYSQRPEVKKRRKKYLKEYLKEYYQKHKEENREQLKQYKKEYDKKNKERLNKYALEYYYNHLEQDLKNKKNFKKNNPNYFKEYSEKNREELNVKRNKRTKSRRKKDREFCIKTNLRTRVCYILKNYTKTGKIKSSKKYGINYRAIIEYLKPFPKDLSKYHIDHIKPLCSFNLEDPEEIKIAFAPENHQWLLASENLSKGGKII